MTASSHPPRWLGFADAAALQTAAVAAIADAAEAALRLRGRFDIVLAGGTTPKAIYAACRGLATDWSRWHCYFGDERCLPIDDPERNSVMARAAWLDHVPIPAAQIYAIPAELGATSGAVAYARTLSGVGSFDFVLLGLGEDGHTASLFPGHAWGETADAADALPVFNAPKPPPERVSMSAARLSRARRVVFAVTGESKRTAVNAWRAGEALPASAISADNAIEIFCEQGLLAPSP
ncbi:6-phosphogluconolactonase [Propionivibrio dicarboxylicus]|uniref:6-phosphogluconolactonase n=1 Tax=Propionivibrio dicarboxylicus TaxID=83767 RepID=A0A1G8JY71_9RHOO|nr:6-phosphogluconolactonase [Propionivibrio dicarboxylicus]SDI36141.1 6-phosphogluconolactonase [Propionivibrio dicarboxylicus]